MVFFESTLEVGFKADDNQGRVLPIVTDLTTTDESAWERSVRVRKTGDGGRASWVGNSEGNIRDVEKEKRWQSLSRPCLHTIAGWNLIVSPVGIRGSRGTQSRTFVPKAASGEPAFL